MVHLGRQWTSGKKKLTIIIVIIIIQVYSYRVKILSEENAWYPGRYHKEDKTE